MHRNVCALKWVQFHPKTTLILSELNRIIEFYRDCYQFDLKGVRIKNFISNQCEKRYVPTTTNFFTNHTEKIAVDSDWGKVAEQILFVDAKEKILYAGSLFIKGKQNTLGKTRTAYVPFYIHELTLTSEAGRYYVTIEDTYINPDFVELANALDSTLNISLDEVSKHAPPHPFGTENIELLKTFFSKYMGAWNAWDIRNYADAEFHFKNYFTRSKAVEISNLKLLSCFMIGVFKKPEGSMGILHELTHLAEQHQKSAVLDTFFGLKDFSFTTPKKRPIYLPAVLSRKQESAFYAADTFSISQIVGPPGTGKSFTIASLAIDAISNGKSVLVVTRNTQASKVITNIIEKEFRLKGVVIKAYNQVYKRGLSSKLGKAISVEQRRNINPEHLLKAIHRVLDKIERVEKEIIEIEADELKWGAFYAEYQDGFFATFKDKWFQYKKRRAIPIGTLNDTLKELRNEKTRLVKKYITRKIAHDLAQQVKAKKVEFLKLNATLKEKNLTLVDKKLKQVDFNLVLDALPLWATTTKEISKCLPLKQGLFDLVIFDEASQCDVASSIPVLYRAKKAIVVGDPHQLQHISFLSDKKQSDLRLQHGIVTSIPDYRKESLINWTNTRLSNPEQMIFLDEHFRSKTDLIRFSNENFYENQLKLVRSNPICDATSSFEIIATNGTRGKDGSNPIEVEHIVNTLKQLIKSYKDYDANLIPTIGVISPFTQQVQLLKKSIAKAIPFNILKQHKVLIGTPFHFQGEERDIVLISFCLDDNAHFAALNYLNRSDVFNVLVTRAKNKQLLYTSFTAENLPVNSLLKLYVESANIRNNRKHTSEVYDEFLDDVSEFLKASGFEIVHQSMTVSGVLIDLVVVHNNNYFCIDLIGYPGDFEAQFSLEQLRILNRLETPLFFLTYSSWHLEEKQTKRELLGFIEGKTAE